MTSKEHLSKHDREIAAIRTLLRQGMRMLVDTQQQVKDLASAQRKTEESLRAFIDSLRRGGNGHSKRKVDLP